WRSQRLDDCRAAAGAQGARLRRRDNQAEDLIVARVGGLPGPRFRSSAVRRRKLSTFISKMVAWWTRRSTAARVMAWSGKILPHSPKGWLAVISMERRS